MMLRIIHLIVAAAWSILGSHAFSSPTSSLCLRLRPSSTSSLLAPLHAAPAKQVHILPAEDDVTHAIHAIVESAANLAIQSRGHFTLAIPGGSVLKILSTLTPTSRSDWLNYTTIIFVNHKCVPVDNVATAIEAQARAKFINTTWSQYTPTVISLDGSNDGVLEAMNYEKKLRALSAQIVPRDSNSGFPIIDLALIGVGDDGHIGSLYPNRDEIDITTGPWVVSSTNKDPPGISLSLPVMQHAKQTVIVAAGQSVKYPNGKASAMKLAILDEKVTPTTFPACALREFALWILDEANGSEIVDVMGMSTLDKAIAAAAAAMATQQLEIEQ